MTRTLDVERGTNFVALLFDHSGSRLAGPGGVIWDLDGPPDAEPLRLRRPGPVRFGVAFGPMDDVLATSVDMSVSLWPLTHAYPVVLAGHGSSASPRAFTADGTRLVSTSRDRTVRVWPMPDVDTPPIHTLPREQLIAMLESLTNLRVERDAASPTGWKLVTGPFPGWATLPTW